MTKSEPSSLFAPAELVPPAAPVAAQPPASAALLRPVRQGKGKVAQGTRQDKCKGRERARSAGQHPTASAIPRPGAAAVLQHRLQD